MSKQDEINLLVKEFYTNEENKKRFNSMYNAFHESWSQMKDHCFDQEYSFDEHKNRRLAWTKGKVKQKEYYYGEPLC